MKKVLWVMMVLTVVLGIGDGGPADAQVAGATVSGAVTNDAGAALVNAKVSIKNLVTGIVRTAKTDKDGQRRTIHCTQPVARNLRDFGERTRLRDERAT
jgi:hypothetical protein